MQRQNVTSSNIASVGYDSNQNKLEIEFLDGGIYQYDNVPQSIYCSLMSASSHGGYFHQYIKNEYNCIKTY